MLKEFIPWNEDNGESPTGASEELRNPEASRLDGDVVSKLGKLGLEHRSGEGEEENQPQAGNSGQQFHKKVTPCQSLLTVYLYLS